MAPVSPPTRPSVTGSRARKRVPSISVYPLETLSIGPDVRFEKAEKLWPCDGVFQKLDVRIFHVVEKYELFQKQARIEFDAELFLCHIDDVGERGVLPNRMK